MRLAKDRKHRGREHTANGHHLEDELGEPRWEPTPTSCVLIDQQEG